MNLGSLIADMMRDQQSLLTALLVFLAAGTLAFTVMAFVRVRGAVKRRTERVMEEGGRSNPKRSLRYASLTAVAQLIEYTTKHYASTESDTMKVLRTRLIQAGIFDPRAVAVFFIGRTALAVALAVAGMVLLPMVMSKGGSAYWLLVIVSGIAGYIGPSMYIDQRIKSSTAWAFPISWTCWWCAPTPACRWKPRSSASAASSATAIPRSPPTST